VIVAGNFTVYDNNNTFNVLQVSGNTIIYGNNGQYGEVLLGGNGTVTGDNTFGILEFTPGNAYTLTYGKTQTITNDLITNGSCTEPITIQSSSSGNQTTISKTSGTITVDYAIMEDQNATGGATFIANNTIDLGNNTGWIINPPAPLDLFWVGGTGDWNDPNHWSFASGGASGACIPTSIDDVFFDANSFTASGQTVTLIGDGNNNVNCKDMDWTGATFDPILAGIATCYLRIYGSLTLNPNMNYNFAGKIVFEATNIGNTILTAGIPLDNNYLYFSGVGGGWILQDGLNMGNQRIYFTNGTLNTNSQPIYADRIYSENTNIRTLLLGSSVLTLSENSSSAFRCNGTNMTLDAGTSLFKFIAVSGGLYCNGTGNLGFYDVVCEAITGTSTIYNLNGSFNTIKYFSSGSIRDGNTIDSVIVAGNFTVYDNNNTFNVLQVSGNTIIYGNNGQYGEVLLGGNGTITGDNTFGMLEFTEGNAYTLTYGKTQTIQNDFIANGTSTNLIVIQSNSAGNQSNFSKASGTVTVEYVSLKDNNATGGATFIANNSIDLGNVTGWFINSGTGTDYFWVGGTGSWNDPAYWASTSGGVGGAGVPTILDNVFFDANSFTAPGQVVTIIGDASHNANCLNMDWTGTTNDPELAGAATEFLKIYGSLTFISNMSFNFLGKVYFEATDPGHTVTCAGLILDINDIYFNGDGGEWTLQDELNVGDERVYLNYGTLITNDQPVFADRFYSSTTNTRTLILGSSVLTIAENSVSAVTINGTNLTMDAGTSLIKLTSVTGGMNCTGTGTLAFNNLICEAITGTSEIRNLNGSFNTIVFNSAGELEDGNTVDSITFYGNGTIRDDNNNINYLEFNAIGTINNDGTYGEVYMGGDGSITNDNTFGTLEFTAGNVYTLTYNKTQIIQNDLIANGSCTEPITIQSSSAGNQTTISKTSGTITINRVSLQDNNATGGATFIANNTLDLGNNTGWTINPVSSEDLYWVGGTGDWDDVNHWAATSGGAGGYCLPSQIDNVIFDINSFTQTGQAVYINITDAECQDMDWSGAAFSPTFTALSNTYNLHIYGSLILNPSMNLAFSGLVYFDGVSTSKATFNILMEGHHFNNNVYFNGDGGEWVLLDEFSTGTSNLILNYGTLNTNDQIVDCNRFISTNFNTRSLILGSTVININSNSSSAWNVTGDNFTINAGTSEIRFTASGGGMISTGGSPLVYNAAVFQSGGGLSVLNSDDEYTAVTFSGDGRISGSGTFNTVVFNGDGEILGTNNFGLTTFINNGEINGANLFNILALSPGKTYQLEAGSTQSINNQIDFWGNNCDPITMISTSTGIQANISCTAGTIEGNYIYIQDMNAMGGATFNLYNSLDLGNNTGWNFLDPPGDFFDLKVILEGPFNGTDMNTDINSFIPLFQPYNNPPWNYISCENVPAIPTGDIVDWILIELRDASDANSATGVTMIAQQAAFL
ncbi:MAG: hypothetical protein K8R53_05995, partial [Bacteroidales bacterium]|nr:hypothetical protein [Bacteroidales bacterium]